MTLDRSSLFTRLCRMMKPTSRKKITLSLAALATYAVMAQTGRQGPPDHPTVDMFGQTYSPKFILTRNMGTAEDQETAFPPHNIIANIYYVGTKTLSSFLIVTPEGNILIDSTYERNVPVILKSVEQLGFKFSDIKILLGNHAHPDHMEGDALVKQLTGAKVEVMAEDVPALNNLKPEGKVHPVDVVFHDGDKISLGGVTLTAHLVAGHTRGCTTFTTVVQDHGKPLNVVFGCSLRAPNVVTPAIAAEFDRSFAVARSLPCDVMLGDHPSEFEMTLKYPKIKPGAPNPYIDKPTCLKEINIEEAMYKAIVAEQNAAQPKP